MSAQDPLEIAASLEAKRLADAYVASRPITSMEVATSRCAELWALTVAFLARQGVVFVSRQDIGPKHSLVDIGVYRAAMNTPTHGKLDAAVVPELGRAMLADVKKATRQRVCLVRDALKPTLDRRGLEVVARVFWFEVESNVIEIARTGL